MPDDSNAGLAIDALPKPIDLKALVPDKKAITDDSPGKGTPTSVGPPTIVDKTRQGIAYFLLALLTGVILIQLIGGAIYGANCWANGSSKVCVLATQSLGIMSSSMTPIFTAMIGLVGSVVGFYFGSKSASE